MKKTFSLVKSSKAGKPVAYLKAFTLIELLVVIAIIGTLAGMILVSVTAARAKSRDVIRKNDLAQIAKALEMYYTDNERYPLINYNGYYGMDISRAFFGPDWRSFGSSTLKSFVIPNYIKKLPIDPINNNNHFYFLNIVFDHFERDSFHAYQELNGKYFQLLTKLENGNDTDTAYKKNTKVFSSPINCNVFIWPPHGSWCVDIVSGKLIELSISDPSFPEGFLKNPVDTSDRFYLSGDINELKKVYVIRNGM